MHTFSVIFSRVGLPALAGILLTAPALAQDIEELIVSVRKTDENIQEVPVQVTSLSDEIIRSEAIRNIGDVARLTPSLQFDQGFWSQDTRVSIRGLFNRAGRPSAAVLIDGIDAISEAFESSGGSALLNQRLLDVERIEVARGPQSALYGRAAFSGAINYVTRRPTQEFESFAEGRFGEGGRRELRGSVSGGLIDDVLSAKVIGSYYELDGDYTNPNTGGKLGGGESLGFGVSFNWTPVDDVSVYWNNTYTDDEFAPQAVALIGADSFRILKADGSLIPNGGPGDCDTGGGDSCLWAVTGTIKADANDIDVSPDPQNPGKDYPGTSEETFRSNLIVDWQIRDDLTFRSSTSYTDSEQDINFDSTQVFTVPVASAGNYADAENAFKFKQLYQEFQLFGDAGDRANWLVGVNVFVEKANDVNTSAFWYRDPNNPFCPGGFFGLPPAPCAIEDTPRFNKRLQRDTLSLSAFALYAWQFADQWKATFEGRLIKDEVKVQSSTRDLGADALNPIFSDPSASYQYAGTPGTREKVDGNNLLPRFTLEYLPNDMTMVYASVAKGIKPPTFNTTDFVGTNPDNGLNANAVGREKLWTYEIGAKNTLNDGKLLLNGALFYNDYRDQQVRVQFPRPGGGIPTSGAVNAGKVTVYGLEVDASWLPTERWLLNASYAFTKGEYDDFNIEQAQLPTGADLGRSEKAKAANASADLSGFDTPGTPENAASFLARYTAPLQDSMEWYGQFSASYQGKRWADKTNLVRLDSYVLANGQLGVANDNWQVALYVENLFDDDTVRYAQEFIDQSQGFSSSTFTFPVGYFAYLPQPRTVGLQISYRTR